MPECHCRSDFGCSHGRINTWLLKGDGSSSPIFSEMPTMVKEYTFCEIGSLLPEIMDPIFVGSSEDKSKKKVLIFIFWPRPSWMSLIPNLGRRELWMMTEGSSSLEKVLPAWILISSIRAGKRISGYAVSTPLIERMLWMALSSAKRYHGDQSPYTDHHTKYG